MMSPVHPHPAGRFKSYYRTALAALASRTIKGSVLLLAVALVASGTGAVVLFIDMPLIVMAALSAISLVALIFFVAAARARFFPPTLPVAAVSTSTNISPEKVPGGKTGTVPTRPTYRDLPAHILAVPMSMGNRTGRGDALILATCMVAILAGYAALFIDLPLVFLILLGILSLATVVLAGIASAFRFAPGQMAALVPALHNASPSRAGPGQPAAGTVPVPGHEPVPADLPEKPGGGIRDVYWVQSPYVYIKIERQGNLGLVYTVVEPVITTREKIVLQETYSYLRDVIIYDHPEKSPADQLKQENIYHTLQEYDPTIHDGRLPVLYYFLQRDLSGFGLLEPLMHDPALEDISCNGENLPVFVFHRSYGSLPTSVLFHKGELNQYVLKLAQKANKQISLSNPMVDASLPDGSRLQVTYSNVISTNGSSFTIRKFRADPMTPLDLIKFGTYNAEILAFLWLVIEHRRSLIIAGGTASGKTSTMNAVSLFIPLNSKIVSLEDTREIQLPHKNWLATQTRELSTPGMIGDIDLFSLLKSSMRQRPEYIIVGEVRGAEAQTLFQAMNTGHATLSTIHAGSVQEAVNRLTHEPINVPSVMFTALDLVVNQSVFTYGNNRVRRCSAISEISVDAEGNIIPVKLYEWDVSDDRFHKVSPQSRVLREIALMRNWTMDRLTEELKKREEFLNLAVDVPTPDIIDLANAIHDLGE
ncbi:type II/IV secretion system ATPase subunit [Methanoregula sp.]|uniref:type II/IV secretion system ATPase subunit n=1 Tax=Methanoregula sp. TaxID=2052170 RepID=UPI003BAFF20B